MHAQATVQNQEWLAYGIDDILRIRFDLIEQLLKTESGTERTPLFKELMGMLLAHSHAEQNVLYKKMEKAADEKAPSFAFQV